MVEVFGLKLYYETHAVTNANYLSFGLRAKY